MLPQLTRPFTVPVLAIAALVGWTMFPDRQDAQTHMSGLEGAFEDGGLVQDRNGDGHIDFVNARIVLGRGASQVEIVAAANIAARLGFETESIDLPLHGGQTGIPVAIGLAALSTIGISSSAIAVDLEPGIGVASYLETDLGPVIALVAGDDEGLRAAALAFGGRAPYLWEVDGATYADVARTVRDVLTDAGSNVVSSTVRNIVADGRTGLRRMDVSVVVPSGAVTEVAGILAEIGQTRLSPNDTAEADTSSTAPSLRFPGLRLLRVEVSSPDDNASVLFIENEEEPEPHSGRRPGGGNKEDISLGNLYTNDGFLGDGDNNLIPDRVDVVLSPAEDPHSGIIDLAARIGLESTGVTYPMVVPASDIDDPESFPPLVLLGRNHPLVRQLVDSQQVSLPDLAAGEGWISVVPEAFGDKAAVVVIGGDSAGEGRAIEQLAEHSPHIWNRGKGEPTLLDVDQDLRRALSGRSPVGQAAMALYRLDQIAAAVQNGEFASAQVGVFVEKADSGLSDFLRLRLAQRFPTDSLQLSIGNLDVLNARPIFDENVEVPSEVDAFWQAFHNNVLPNVRPGVRVGIEARLSEPPEIRQHITEEVIRQLGDAGVSREQATVSIVSAYKQGYSWLAEMAGPALRQVNADEIVIKFAEVGPPEGWPQQAMYTPTRWLLEIFPIDEILARDLGLDLSRIRFEMQPVGSVAYEVLGLRNGQTVFNQAFEPSIYLRPYFDRFPDYEMSRVTTGWITGTVDTDTVVTQRIVTDIEAFWDHFQSKTLMRIYDHVMAVNEGRPRSSDAPHFGELTVDVTLSEPDYRIGVDEEQVASMEALHEEIYFGVLHFFDVLGRMARGQELSYPGRVIPVVRPKSDGAAGNARITFTGFDAPGPMVIVTARDRQGRDVEHRRELLPLPLETPRLISGSVKVDQPGWSGLGYRVPVDFNRDNRAEWVLRTSARNVDGNITTAEQTTAMLTGIEELRSAGLYQESLAYNYLGGIDVSAYWGREFDPDSQVTATLAPNGVPRRMPQLSEREGPRGGEPMVQWNTPIPPPEAAEILARMATFPEATVYRVGESYLGKAIWAIDLTAPVYGAYWSQAKATVRKPTVIYSARQHANEVSSTSHVLKLAEQILTDSAYADVLKSVNVVIHPITNPDGAQLAYDLHQITPNHMLHAGYLGSLGVDVASGQGSDDPMYPETRVRPNLWETWLPDIFLNPHGYPSHEWVQIFSEYAGWVRSRVTSQRGWWGMRGWFMPSFSYVDSPDFPRHRDAAFEIRDRITNAINGIPEIRALNRRAYDRYRRYGFAFDTENFKMDFSDSVLIYTSLTGSSGEGGTMSNPRVTIWSGTTEAPDETASGEWLQLVASAGLAWDNALLSYLVEGDHEVERNEVAFADGVTFKIHRERPPRKREEN